MAIPKVVRRISVVLLLLASVPESMGVPLLVAGQMATDQHIESRGDSNPVKVFARRYHQFESLEPNEIVDGEFLEIYFGNGNPCRSLVFKPSAEQLSNHGTMWDVSSERQTSIPSGGQILQLGTIQFPSGPAKKFLLGSLRFGDGVIFSETLFVLKGKVLTPNQRVIEHLDVFEAMMTRLRDLPGFCRRLLEDMDKNENEGEDENGGENENEDKVRGRKKLKPLKERKRLEKEREKLKKEKEKLKERKENLKEDVLRIIFNEEINKESGLTVWTEYAWVQEDYSAYKEVARTTQGLEQVWHKREGKGKGKSKDETPTPRQRLARLIFHRPTASDSDVSVLFVLEFGVELSENCLDILEAVGEEPPLHEFQFIQYLQAHL
ncbi:hypothetical protein F5880DRAFT_1507536 [Lentinula raphanica]|nr:hypothetical protein F5880DRAFT_1507536 [Lentinula raphanica]